MTIMKLQRVQHPNTLPKEKNPSSQRKNGLQRLIISTVGQPRYPSLPGRKLCVPLFREVCLYHNYYNLVSYRHRNRKAKDYFQTKKLNMSAGPPKALRDLFRTGKKYLLGKMRPNNVLHSVSATVDILQCPQLSELIDNWMIC